eukprot:COSAG05_NODE_14342_length_399_cov_1.386667_1_plen_71_part_00
MRVWIHTRNWAGIKRDSGGALLYVSRITVRGHAESSAEVGMKACPAPLFRHRFAIVSIVAVDVEEHYSNY